LPNLIVATLPLELAGHTGHWWRTSTCEIKRVASLLRNSFLVKTKEATLLPFLLFYAFVLSETKKSTIEINIIFRKQEQEQELEQSKKKQIVLQTKHILFSAPFHRFPIIFSFKN